MYFPSCCNGWLPISFFVLKRGKEVKYLLEKTFILYREIIVGDDWMECVYFSEGHCTAQPAEMKLIHHKPFYQPTEEERKALCQTKEDFLRCGRFIGYQQHLRAMGLKK